MHAKQAYTKTVQSIGASTTKYRLVADEQIEAAISVGKFEVHNLLTALHSADLSYRLGSIEVKLLIENLEADGYTCTAFTSERQGEDDYLSVSWEHAGGPNDDGPVRRIEVRPNGMAPNVWLRVNMNAAVQAVLTSRGALIYASKTGSNAGVGTCVNERLWQLIEHMSDKDHPYFGGPALFKDNEICIKNIDH